MNKKEIYEIQMENGVYKFKLFQALKNKGITQSRFIREMETSYATMIRYAKGTVQKIDLEMLDRWCAYLNCTFSDLIEYEKK